MTLGNSTNLKRVAFSPGEFAALFGKSQTWGYRQIYAGKVKAITEYGRLSIPAAEVERILATAGIYDGLKPKPAATKAQLQSLAPKLAGVWHRYIKQRRQGENKDGILPAPVKAARKKPPFTGSARQAALLRLAGKRNPERKGDG